MKKNIIFTMLFLLICTMAFANATDITRTFSHKVSPFNDSKDYNHEIHMPFNLRSQGYSFVSRSIVKRGDASVRNENLTAHSYTFTMHISKSFLEKAKGEVIVTLHAAKGGTPGYVTPGTNPAPLPGTPVVGGSWGKQDPNNPPSVDYPQPGTRVIFNNKHDRITFSWNDQLGGKQFKLRIYTESGKKIKEKVVNSKRYTMEADRYRTGRYKWQVARNNRAGFLTDIPLIGQAFSDWSKYSEPVMFNVQRRDLYNGDDQGYIPPQYNGSNNNTSPSAGASSSVVYAPTPTSPARGANVPQNSAIKFAWNGDGNEFEVGVINGPSSYLFKQSTTAKTLSVPASRFQANKNYKWRVRQKKGSTWSDWSPLFNFRIVTARAQLKSAIEAQYDFRDNDLARQKLESLTENEEMGSRASIMLAENYMDSGKYAEALKILRNTLNKKDSDKKSIYSNMINCYLEMGNSNAASNYAEKLNKEFPGTPEAIEVKSLLK